MLPSFIMTPQEARKAADERNLILERQKDERNAKRFDRDNRKADDVMRHFDTFLENAIKEGKYEFILTEIDGSEYSFENGISGNLDNFSQFVQLVCKKIKERGFNYGIRASKGYKVLDLLEIVVIY